MTLSDAIRFFAGRVEGAELPDEATLTLTIRKSRDGYALKSEVDGLFLSDSGHLNEY